MKTLTCYSALILATALTLISCRGGTNSGNGPTDGGEPNLHDVSVSVSPSGAGTITPSADSLYEEGTTVQLQASPNSEYIFTGWSGSVESSENPLALTVDKDYNLMASFDPKTYPLSIQTEGEGGVSEQVVGKPKDYEHGTVVELTATPGKGYRFTGWKGGLDGNENPVQITVNEPKEVTAVFEKRTYTLSVTTSGQGAVSEEVIQAKVTDYEYGAIVELTASAATGWEFSGWQGDISDNGNPTRITVDEAKEVTAVFEQSIFTLAANGITIICPDADVGDSGSLDGIMYTKRTEDQITTSNASTTCTSGITDMEQLFVSATDFNEDISHWDVSSVTDMRFMFYRAAAFNSDLSHWDVSNVTSMREMFREATSFNQDISDWDVANVTDMRYLFSEASSFNQDISSWNVGSAETMQAMFMGAASFDQDIDEWDVSSVTNIGQMFAEAASFNQDLNSWDVSNVTEMFGVFSLATNFNGDISSWDVANVTSMNGIFSGATSFNQDISGWNVGNVENMFGMFGLATSFNQDISGWDVSSTESMMLMFQDATSFDQDISGWDVSSVLDMTFMFKDATSFDQDLSGWCVTEIDTEPFDFAAGAGFDENAAYMPVWGTCPE